MRLLLDTHAFLWFVAGDERLPHPMRELIADGANDVSVSVASLWEMAIKISTGKLHVAEPLELFIARELSRNRLELLLIDLPHLAQVAVLPFHHRDPFDRLLIAQAAVEQMPLVSADNWFDPYGVTRLW